MYVTFSAVIPQSIGWYGYDALGALFRGKAGRILECVIWERREMKPALISVAEPWPTWHGQHLANNSIYCTRCQQFYYVYHVCTFTVCFIVKLCYHVPCWSTLSMASQSWSSPGHVLDLRVPQGQYSMSLALESGFQVLGLGLRSCSWWCISALQQISFMFFETVHSKQNSVLL